MSYPSTFSSESPKAAYQAVLARATRNGQTATRNDIQRVKNQLAAESRYDYPRGYTPYGQNAPIPMPRNNVLYTAANQMLEGFDNLARLDSRDNYQPTYQNTTVSLKDIDRLDEGDGRHGVITQQDWDVADVVANHGMGWLPSPEPFPYPEQRPPIPYPGFDAGNDPAFGPKHPPYNIRGMLGLLQLLMRQYIGKP